MKVLDIGCGNRKREGAFGIDVDPQSAADLVHDLNIFPYPIQTTSSTSLSAKIFSSTLMMSLRRWKRIPQGRKTDCRVK